MWKPAKRPAGVPPHSPLVPVKRQTLSTVRFYDMQARGIERIEPKRTKEDEKRRFRGEPRWGGSIPGLAGVGTHVPCGVKKRFMAGTVSDRPCAEGFL